MSGIDENVVLLEAKHEPHTDLSVRVLMAIRRLARRSLEMGFYGEVEAYGILHRTVVEREFASSRWYKWTVQYEDKFGKKKFVDVPDLFGPTAQGVLDAIRADEIARATPPSTGPNAMAVAIGILQPVVHGGAP